MPYGHPKTWRSYTFGGITMSPSWVMSLTKLKTLSLEVAPKLMSLPPLEKLPFLELLTIQPVCSLKKVGVEFLGKESENKKEDIVFPNLKRLWFLLLGEWKEWIGIGGMRVGGKEDKNCITIMPHFQVLKLFGCGKLNSLPDFLRTTTLKELRIIASPILKEHCQRETGEDWHKISQIPFIKFNKYYSKFG